MSDQYEKGMFGARYEELRVKLESGELNDDMEKLIPLIQEMAGIKKERCAAIDPFQQLSENPPKFMEGDLCSIIESHPADRSEKDRAGIIFERYLKFVDHRVKISHGVYLPPEPVWVYKITTIFSSDSPISKEHDECELIEFDSSLLPD